MTDPPAALHSPAGLGRRVAVVGGGITGAETAWHLALEGHQVTLVERGPGLGGSVNLIAGLVLPEALAAAGVHLRFGATATAVRDGCLTLETADGIEGLPVDGVVVACGATGAASSPRSQDGPPATEVHVVGDLAGPRGLLDAIHGGARVGRLI